MGHSGRHNGRMELACLLPLIDASATGRRYHRFAQNWQPAC